MKTLIINFKNYGEVLGPGSLELAKAAASVSARVGVEVIVAPPTPMLAMVSSRVDVGVFSQAVVAESGEKTTGAVLPEAVKAAGARGTLLNHSEARLSRHEIKELMPRLGHLGLAVCLCAGTSSEAAELSKLGAEYLAVEPPELIGSGIAVSRAKPGLISRTVSAARREGYKGKILCGAGIVDGNDVAKAVELGADGVLVASSVVKARNWAAKVEELARSLKKRGNA